MQSDLGVCEQPRNGEVNVSLTADLILFVNRCSCLVIFHVSCAAVMVFLIFSGGILVVALVCFHPESITIDLREPTT